MKPLVYTFKASKLPYLTSTKLQNHLSSTLKSKISAGSRKPDGYLVLVEHNPVYTIGIRSKDYGPDVETKLRNLGAEFYRTNRGGLITFHGPGQLIAYPILNLKVFKPSVRWYISKLESTIIRACAYFQLNAVTSPHTGVWIDDKKVCAIGVHVSQYVTSHGLALNCDTDLKWFEYIIPCGIEGKGVTSLSEECGRRVNVAEASVYFLRSFCEEFDCSLADSPKELVEEALQIVNGANS